PTTSLPSPLSSTVAHAKHSAGQPQPTVSLLSFISNNECCDDP
ncbi:MAG: hypothetical protein JWP07_4119, partial [Pseudonocardiales bacterium]|nr:hypothetical protein [Pseudonocardiales bacterium]